MPAARQPPGRIDGMHTEPQEEGIDIGDFRKPDDARYRQE
jgi:hypothetical protein